MKRNSIICLVFSICSFPIISYYLLSLPFKSYNVNLSDNKYYIAHGGGGIDGYTYTNCKEALLGSLDKGYKFVELDFSLTSDSVLVCAHGPQVFNKITGGNVSSTDMPNLKEFENSRILGEYTPLTAKEALHILIQRPFILLVDFISDPEIIDKNFSEFKDQIMVETTSIENYIGLEKKGYLPMLTLGDLELRSVIKFLLCQVMCKKPIRYATVTVNCRWRNLRVLKRVFNLSFFAYTSNSVDFVNNHLGTDVDKVYTDFLL